MHYAKSEADDLIKQQGVRSKNFMPNSCAEETETAEFAASSVTIRPQEEIMGDVDMNTIEETTGYRNNDKKELIMCEDDNNADPELCYEENM